MFSKIQHFQIVGNTAFMSSPMASLFVDLSNFLIVLNCSSNFWVFIIWGKRFRRSCRHVLLSTHIGINIYKLAHFGSDPVRFYRFLDSGNADSGLKLLQSVLFHHNAEYDQDLWK